MGYLGRCLRRAFAGSVLLTDKISVVMGVLTPALFLVAGKSLDQAYQAYIAWGIILVVGGGIFLRMLTAPYFIWKDDQLRIANLESIITDTSRRRREFFEDTFLSERAGLAKKFNQYAQVVPAPADAAKFDADAHLSALTSDAAFFLGDQNFKIYWDTFCLAFRNMVRGGAFLDINKDALPRDHSQNTLDRYHYDLNVTKSAAGALVFILTENSDHSNFYRKSIETLNDKYSHVISVDPEITFWTFRRP